TAAGVALDQQWFTCVGHRRPFQECCGAEKPMLRLRKKKALL
ncbi:MAG: hypothetical protein ACJAUW_001644, partial [Yoonia sp.]